MSEEEDEVVYDSDEDQETLSEMTNNKLQKKTEKIKVKVHKQNLKARPNRKYKKK